MWRDILKASVFSCHEFHFFSFSGSMSHLITVTLILVVALYTVHCYPSVISLSSDDARQLERAVPSIYSASSGTTYRLASPSRAKRQLAGDAGVDETLARLDLLCNKLKKRSTHSSLRRQSRDAEKLLSFLCKSIVNDSDLL